MPVYRNADPLLLSEPRRSRRLSRQEPKRYDEDGFEYLDPVLLSELHHASPAPSQTSYSEPSQLRTISRCTFATSPPRSRSPTPYSPSPSPSRSPSPFPSPALHSAHRLSSGSTGLPSKSPKNSQSHANSSIPASPSPRFHPYAHSSPRSHTQKRSNTKHIPRPPNAFMLYRSHFWSTQKDTIPERDHRQISRLTGVMWNQLPEDQKEVFRREAEAVKKEHMAKFPDYKYAPSRDGYAGTKKNTSLGRRGSGSVAKNTKIKAKCTNGTCVSRPKKQKARRVPQAEVKKCQELAEKLLSNDALYTMERSPSPSPVPVPAQAHEDDPDADADGDTEDESTTGTDMDNEADSEDVEPKIEASPDLSTPKCSYPFDVQYKSQLDSDDEENIFVPTEDIPPLDLSAPSSASAEVKEAEHESKPDECILDTSTISTPTPGPVPVPVPPSYVHIDPQFGVKPDTHRLSPSPDSALSDNDATPKAQVDFSLLFSDGSEASMLSYLASYPGSDAVPTVLSSTSSTFSSSVGPSPFNDSANPDAWLHGTEDLHYFYDSIPETQASGSGCKSPQPLCPALDFDGIDLNELLQTLDPENFDLEPSISLNEMFDEFVVMPMEEF
ncbi:hypothetical protein VKT23_000048 [Stygiomarasmius scandens]|uniref:HMG box domain-containing protein n=1 Tax=Marasmiellus scandens TaxID=2682957 RepID=A0ABR1K438_9AGAR